MRSHLTDISHVIQLATAPVFLLTAVATLFISAMPPMIAGLRLFPRAACLAACSGTQAPL